MKLTNAQRKAIYRRDGYQCALCGSTRYLQIHHYIPRGKCSCTVRKQATENKR